MAQVSSCRGQAILAVIAAMAGIFMIYDSLTLMLGSGTRAARVAGSHVEADMMASAIGRVVNSEQFCKMVFAQGATPPLVYLTPNGPVTVGLAILKFGGSGATFLQVGSAVNDLTITGLRMDPAFYHDFGLQTATGRAFVNSRCYQVNFHVDYSVKVGLAGQAIGESVDFPMYLATDPATGQAVDCVGLYTSPAPCI